MRTLGSAQQLHLNRVARMAGEAFAFDEPDKAPARNRSGVTHFLWLAVAAVAAAALWLAA